MDLTPLKVSRDFRLLFFGHSVSNFGDEIVAVAIPYQVYQLTGSTFAVGLLGIAALVPLLTISFLGGAIAAQIPYHSPALAVKEARRAVLELGVLIGGPSIGIANSKGIVTWLREPMLPSVFSPRTCTVLFALPCVRQRQTTSILRGSLLLLDTHSARPRTLSPFNTESRSRSTRIVIDAPVPVRPGSRTMTRYSGSHSSSAAAGSTISSRRSNTRMSTARWLES